MKSWKEFSTTLTSLYPELHHLGEEGEGNLMLDLYPMTDMQISVHLWGEWCARK